MNKKNYDEWTTKDEELDRRKVQIDRIFIEIEEEKKSLLDFFRIF